MTLLGESSGVEENIASCHLPYDIVVISESAHIRPGGVGVADTHGRRARLLVGTRSPPGATRARRAPPAAPTPAPTEARVRQTTRPARVAGGGAEASRRSRGGVAARVSREYPSGGVPGGTPPRRDRRSAATNRGATRRDDPGPHRATRVPSAGPPRTRPGTRRTPGPASRLIREVDARRPWRRCGCMGSEDVSSLESGAFYLY